MSRTVAVIGGGIAGLAAAHALVTRHGCEVVLCEASDRLGGKILTTPFAGRMVDEGADAFLARVPAAVELARAVGLGDDLTSPAAGNAFVSSGKSLVPLPKGIVLGVPTDFAELRRSGAVSTVGALRAALDLVIPGRPLRGDISVGDLVRSRMGAEVNERLVDPMIGGINAGRTEELSLAVAAPQIEAAARSNRSLVRALRAQLAANPPDPTRPVFHAPLGGMTSLVDALEKELRSAGADLRLDAPVSSVRRTADGWVVVGVGDVDGVVVATPAPAAARLLESVATETAVVLRGVEYSSVVLVTLAYPRAAVRHPLDGSGFLVPRRERRLLTACSFASTKWAHLGGSDDVILRASAGRVGDERALALDDDSLVALLHGELAELLGIEAVPSASRVSRWPAAFPQYRPAHLDRMATASRALADAGPGIALAGAAVRGVGIPTCITSGQAAAAAVASAW